MARTPTLDANQKRLHENFPSSSYLSDPVHVERLIAWITFYRKNPSRFVEHYMGIQLHLYQHIILYLIALFPNFCIVAARSAAKSFIIAIYGCMQSVLYPGSHIVIASGTKGQAKLIVTEKIVKEILPRSPLLQAEIAKVRDGQNEIEVTFHNGSTIVVVAANDNARGHRATVLVLEEFRLISKDILDTVLTPFLVMRSADFFNLPEYAHLKEPEKSIYISSAWYKSHWMWKDIVVPFTKEMMSVDRYCVLAMDYSITLRHGLKSMEFMIHEKMTHDPISWTIEYENRMMSENAKAFFTYEQLDKNRRLKKAFYPRKNDDVLLRRKNPFEIPKQPGEIRLVACDIATSNAAGADNSSYSCMRLLPENQTVSFADTTGNHVEVRRGYRRQLVFMEPAHGIEAVKQAIRIKQLYTDFDADYCVLDTRNIGEIVYEMLAKTLYDEERNVEYAPWRCMNDDRLAGKIQIVGAKENVFAIKASLQLNSDIAVAFQQTLNAGMIDFLISNTEAVDEIEKFVPNYSTLSVEDQLWYEQPYMETVAFINETIDLEYERGDQTGVIKITNTTNRKDRYTSVSYGNYFANLLERDLLTDNSEYEFVPLYN